MFPDFQSRQVVTETCTAFVQCGGSGPPLLLLHGFPETHLMWRDIAPSLSSDFTVVCADLPGYGRSILHQLRLPNSQSKRAMAATMVQMMERLGFSSFDVVGHDRGGRVAYRMALDHAQRVRRVCVLDIVPTAAAWDRADASFALSFWPFSLLAQPAPLPERLIGGCPEAVVEAALSQWGTPADIFPADVRSAYIDALCDASQVHGICEEYRAAASIDREHDESDVRAGRRIQASLLILWSTSGGLGSWYVDEGGPLGIWRCWANHVVGEAVPGGHFFPEEYPAETAARLRSFLCN